MRTAVLTIWSMLAAAGLIDHAHADAAPIPDQASAQVEQDVLAFERRRCDAVQRRDIGALRAMLADDLTYVHASGIKQDKPQYLAYVAAGKVTYSSYEIVSPAVRIAGNAAVTHGLFKYEITSAQPPAHGELIYTAVYVRSAEGWQLTAWEATKK